MSDIKIFKKDEATILIEANHIILKEISNYFSVFAANYRFAPIYKAGAWDGKIRYFNTRDNSLPIGLIEKLYEFSRLGKYIVECSFERFNEISKEEFFQFVASLHITNDKGNPMEPRDYQLEAAYQACCKKNLNVLISTSGGKSLVMYIICRFMELQNLQTLIVVPNQGLVEQLYKDFEGYGWNVEYKCHKLYSGQTKVFDRPIIISCWQSMYKDKKIPQQFQCFMVDEAQGAKGKSISDLGKSCSSAQYRFGFSGTYPDPATADWFSIVGTLGPIQTFATYKKLQEDGHIAQIKIFNVILEYDTKTKLDYYKRSNKEYNAESNLIYANEARSEFILKMVQNLKENCLVLFTKKEAHGYKLRELFEQKLKDKTFLYIDGDVPIDEREDIRELVSKRNDIVLLATVSTIGAGWSAKNIHSVIFASGSKSKIRVLQAVGRGLRAMKGKEYLKLFDISDNLSFSDPKNSIRYINYSMKHLKERIKYYEEQGWSYKTIKHKL